MIPEDTSGWAEFFGGMMVFFIGVFLLVMLWSFLGAVFEILKEWNEQRATFREWWRQR